MLTTLFQSADLSCAHYSQDERRKQIPHDSSFTYAYENPSAFDTDGPIRIVFSAQEPMTGLALYATQVFGVQDTAVVLNATDLQLLNVEDHIKFGGYN